MAKTIYMVCGQVFEQGESCEWCSKYVFDGFRWRKKERL